jgi:putative restriction endonuclease
MRYWLGVTDNSWYKHVSSRKFEEVNFWQPSARPPFAHLPEGTPFLFKLKSPNNHIAGGGYFVRFTTFPVATAWDAFGEANGAGNLPEFARLIDRNATSAAGLNPEIGCSILTQVFYLPRERWVPVGEVFSQQTVRGVTRDTAVPAAMQLWNEVMVARSAGIRESEEPDEPRRFGRPFLTAARLGQGSFRALVTDAYKRRCAITGESTLPVLEAAHIRSYASSGPHRISNGLLLRSDFHKLFDLGLITVDPDYTVHVSHRIKDQWYNGKAYYRLHGQKLAVLPDEPLDRPNPEYLAWHNETCFGG